MRAVLLICMKGPLNAEPSGSVAVIVPVMPPSLLIQSKFTGAPPGIDPVPSPIVVQAASTTEAQAIVAQEGGRNRKWLMTGSRWVSREP